MNVDTQTCCIYVKVFVSAITTLRLIIAIISHTHT